MCHPQFTQHCTHTKGRPWCHPCSPRTVPLRRQHTRKNTHISSTTPLLFLVLARAPERKGKGKEASGSAEARILPSPWHLLFSLAPVDKKRCRHHHYRHIQNMGELKPVLCLRPAPALSPPFHEQKKKKVAIEVGTRSHGNPCEPVLATTNQASHVPHHGQKVKRVTDRTRAKPRKGRAHRQQTQTSKVGFNRDSGRLCLLSLRGEGEAGLGMIDRLPGDGRASKIKNEQE